MASRVKFPSDSHLHIPFEHHTPPKETDPSKPVQALLKADLVVSAEYEELIKRIDSVNRGLKLNGLSEMLPIIYDLKTLTSSFLQSLLGSHTTLVRFLNDCETSFHGLGKDALEESTYLEALPRAFYPRSSKHDIAELRRSIEMHATTYEGYFSHLNWEELGPTLQIKELYKFQRALTETDVRLKMIREAQTSEQKIVYIGQVIGSLTKCLALMNIPSVAVNGSYDHLSPSSPELNQEILFIRASYFFAHQMLRVTDELLYAVFPSETDLILLSARVQMLRLQSLRISSSDEKDLIDPELALLRNKAAILNRLFNECVIITLPLHRKDEEINEISMHLTRTKNALTSALENIRREYYKPQDVPRLTQYLEGLKI